MDKINEQTKNIEASKSLADWLTAWLRDQQTKKKKKNTVQPWLTTLERASDLYSLSVLLIWNCIE